jgi:hypothetical protein
MKTKIISFSLLLFLISPPTKAQTWEFVGLDSLVILHLIVEDHTIYAGAWDKVNRLNSGLYYTADSGVDWNRLDNSLGEGAILGLERNKNNTIYIIKCSSTACANLYKSTNNGQNWLLINGISSNPIRWIEISPFNQNELYVIDEIGVPGGVLNNLYKSTNNGINWIELGPFPGSSHGSELQFSFDFTDSLSLYVSVDDRFTNLYFYKSTDKGENWFYVSSPPFFPTDIYSDKTIPDRIYLFGGPYTSSNGGYNWILADSGLSDTAYYRSFFQDQASANLLYMLRTDGLYVSDSDTVFWNRVEDSEYLPLDLPGISNLKNVFIDNTKKKIYVGTTSGIYKKNVITVVRGEKNYKPSEFILEQNYPNPFNPSTMISYQIPEKSFVIVRVYDVLGNEINTIVSEEKLPGEYQVDFSGKDLTSGVYFYVLTAEANNNALFRRGKKMLLIK